jgi:hypothetical protein
MSKFVKYMSHAHMNNINVAMYANDSGASLGRKTLDKWAISSKCGAQASGGKTMNNSDFTRGMLRESRSEAKRLGVAIPTGIHAYMERCGTNLWAEVRDRKGNILWTGSASDAYEARSNAIDEMIAQQTGVAR